MSMKTLDSGQIVYDPRGIISAKAKPLARRVPSLAGLRLGVLDNTKWNGGRLLRNTVALLEQETDFAAVTTYKKENFSKNAAPDLIGQIAVENDIVITAIGD